MTTGRVDIGAFRTYPTDFRAEAPMSQHTGLPTYKAEEYGAHADRYYPLAVELFTTSADRPLFSLLWNEYWVHTLCASPSPLQQTLSLQHTHELVARLRQAQSHVANARMLPSGASFTQAVRTTGNAEGEEPMERLAAELERRAAALPLAKIAAEAYVPLFSFSFVLIPATNKRAMYATSSCANHSNRCYSRPSSRRDMNEHGKLPKHVRTIWNS